MSDPTEPIPPIKVRKKPGPPKGTRYGGKQKGSKNKATIERERLAELEMQAEAARSAVDRAAAAGKKLMKDIAFDFAALFASMAAYYQPQPTIVMGKVINLDANPNANEAKFNQYATLAAQTSIQAAKYQSPSFSAMVVGASVVTKVVVEGGMADDFVAPVPKGEVLDLKPLTVITADDETAHIIELPKAAEG